MDFEDPVVKCKACFCGSCCLGWVITFIVLIATSMTTLSQGEYGLTFSYWAQDITGGVMTDPGVKNVGPLNGMVRYPSVDQLVYFDTYKNYRPRQHEVVKDPVHSRTYDGLQVFVKVSFQWKLQPQHLTGIYRVLGGAEDLLQGTRDENKPDFEAAIVRWARGTLTSICSQYTAAQFFANQSLVESRMKEELSANLAMSDKGVVIGVSGLQLRSVDLPDLYEDAIAETQKNEQDILTAQAERATRIMQLERLVMEAEKNQQEKLVEVRGQVRAIEEENAAWVEQYTNFQKKQADSYATLLRSLANSSDPYKSLFELMKQKALKAHDSNKLSLTM